MQKHIFFILGVLTLGIPLLWNNNAFAAATPLDSIVAVVNDDIVTDSELGERVTTLSRQLRQQRRPLPPNPVLRSQVLERLVLEKLQLQEAKSIGIQVDDDTLNQTLKRIAQENNLSLGEFRSALERDGYDFNSFREDIRRELIIRRLHERQIQQKILVSEQDVDQFLADEDNNVDASKEYHLAHMLVSVPEAATPEQLEKAKAKLLNITTKLKEGQDFGELAVAYSDGQQALDGGDLGWRKGAELPSLFAAVVPRLTPNQVSDVIRGPNGFHMVKLLDVKGEQRHMVQETLARHILIEVSKIKSDSDAAAEVKKLKIEIENGADFAELAKKFSADKNSASQGGKLGWVKPGETVPQFEQTMNALTIGVISEPIQTRFGWHIIQVLERRTVDDTASLRRTQAQQALRQRKIEEETDIWLRRLRDEAYVEYRNSDGN